MILHRNYIFNVKLLPDWLDFFIEIPCKAGQPLAIGYQNQQAFSCHSP